LLYGKLHENDQTELRSQNNFYLENKRNIMKLISKASKIALMIAIKMDQSIALR
jgi:hypothetical protein